MKTKTLLAAGGWRWLAGIGMIGAGVAATVPAKAATEMDSLTSAPDAGISCPVSAFISMIPQRDLSREILGGAPSALERIRLSQSGAASPSEIMSRAAPVMPITLARSWTRAPLEPASQRLTSVTGPTLSGMIDDCRSARGGTIPAPYAIARTFDDPSMEFGTRVVAIKRTRFDARWAKVRKAAPARLMQAELGKAGVRQGLDEREVFARVNRWVNHRIAYRSDDQTYRQRDFWATAQQTIARGAGDCEDFAILKMHMLRAAGVDPHRMKLMLLRDLAANSDHAFLVVQTGAGSVVLDNTTDRVYGGNEAVAIRPVLSFGETGRWVHAYRDNRSLVIEPVPASGTQLAFGLAGQRSVSAVPLTFSTGLSR